MLSFLVFFVLSLLELKHFQLWPQVESLYLIHVHGLQSFTTFIKSFDHPHVLRFIITFYSMYFADVLNTRPDIIFSFICILICTAYKLWFIRKIEITKITFVLVIGYMLLFDVLTFMMNGRFLTALVALPCFFYFIYSNRSVSILQEVGAISLFLIFSGVSSGTFTIIFFIYIATKVIRAIKEKRINYVHWVPLTAILFIFGKLQYVFLEKNIMYFKGNIFRMLNHGVLGKFAISADLPVEIILVLLLIGLLALAVYSVVKMKEKFIVLLLIITCSAGVSLFGVGTMYISMISILSFLTIIIINSNVYSRISRSLE